MKKILITGGSGFIGSELVSKLYSTGQYDITVIDSMSEQIHGRNWEKSFLFNKIKGKVVDSQLAFEKLMEKYLLPCKKRNENITITIKRKYKA